MWLFLAILASSSFLNVSGHDSSASRECSLDVVGDGNYYCNYNLDGGADCYVYCNHQYQGLYMCTASGGFKPQLPYCVRQSGLCTVNEEYKTCGSACNIKTCDDPAPEGCAAVCVSDCFCKEGYLRNESHACVLPEECPDPVKIPPSTNQCDIRVTNGYYQCKTAGDVSTCSISCSGGPNRQYKCKNGKFSPDLPICAQQIKRKTKSQRDATKQTPAAATQKSSSASASTPSTPAAAKSAPAAQPAQPASPAPALKVTPAKVAKSGTKDAADVKPAKASANVANN